MTPYYLYYMYFHFKNIFMYTYNTFIIGSCLYSLQFMKGPYAVFLLTLLKCFIHILNISLIYFLMHLYHDHNYDHNMNIQILFENLFHYLFWNSLNNIWLS